MNQPTSTRDEILSQLKKQKKLSVNHLKKHLNISDMAVRKHLNKLESDQLIHSFQEKQAMGRPATLYSLTAKGENIFPTNYGTMTVEFLSDIEKISGTELVDQLFEKREQRLHKKYNKQIEQHKPLIDKVNELSKIQNKNGYMAEVQQIDDHAIEFTEYNCPIFQVANKYKKACNCELSLFKRVLGVEQIKRTACMSDGDHYCRYLIQKPVEGKK
ncbi:transcriptional regulator [Seinonella peptonophila]|uniref:Transcriptional regulator n=1 Tax=Seinonella peptonophila TaxID=112248 RepID=A0A1M4WGL6_9BACL|nr:metalloregulator ArsR/SmtB family transcription factor [Seinonella peptonophila]SHE80213.1 transcriptional regulator [Seinonella peptonophila]